MRTWSSARKCAVVIGLSIPAILSGCGPRSVPQAASARTSVEARPALPDDLDVVLWLNLVRVRSFWTRDSERQVLSVMREYGFVAAPEGSTDSELWRRILMASSQLWIACRPTSSACEDVVLFARGSFEDALPTSALAGFSSPMLITNGWSRYDRLGNVARASIARVYAAFPDRVMITTPAELDSTERSVEFDQGTSTIPVERRGVFSLSMRARPLARIIERRSPAAARLLRQSTAIRLWLDVEAEQAVLTVVVGFDDAHVAERTREAWVVVATAMGNLDEHKGNEAMNTQIVGTDLVLRIPVRSASSRARVFRDAAPAAAELPDSAAQ